MEATPVDAFEQGVLLEFLNNWLPSLFGSSPIQILEVGCGNGTLSKLLISKYTTSIQLVAIDASSSAVESAKKIGVDALEIDFLKYQPNQLFDVILFTRSLHHINPLSQAVIHAKELLKDNGIIICEEFGRERMDNETARWLFGTIEIIQQAGIAALSSGYHHHHSASEQTSVHAPHTQLESTHVHGESTHHHAHHESAHHHGHDSLHSQIDIPRNRIYVEKWNRHHLHSPPLPPGDEIIKEIGNNFRVLHMDTNIPYLFHYIAAKVEKTERGQKVVTEFLKQEMERFQDGVVARAGIRIVAKKN